MSDFAILTNTLQLIYCQNNNNITLISWTAIFKYFIILEFEIMIGSPDSLYLLLIYPCMFI